MRPASAILILLFLLSVCLLTGRPFSSFREQWSAQEPAGCGVVLTLDRETLNDLREKKTIDDKLKADLTAAINEVKARLKKPAAAGAKA